MIMRLNDVYDKEISGIIDGACSQYTVYCEQAQSIR